MTETKRWLNELPAQSHERLLLTAGRAESPPDGAVDRDWQELRIALGGATVVSVVATTQAAAATAPAASAVAGKVAGTSVGALIYVKSVAVGCAVALGVLGGGSLVQQLNRADAPQASNGNAAGPARQASPPSTHGAQAAAPQAQLPLPIPSETTAKRAKSLPSESASALPASPSTEAVAPETSLAEQARELAQIKRQLDAGATSSALQKLEASLVERAHGQLAEERDALYVQALEKSGRRARAQERAQQFLTRYPNSPQADKMRALLSQPR